MADPGDIIDIELCWAHIKRMLIMELAGYSHEALATMNFDRKVNEICAKYAAEWHS